MLEKGLRGIHQLANRLRESLKTNQFAHLQVIPLTDLIVLFKNQIKGPLIPRYQCASFPESTFIRTDPQVLVSCLFNLVQNAAAAGANRMEIELVKHNNHKADMLIRDNGCGLSPSTMEKLFHHRIKDSSDAAKGIGLMGVQFSLNCMDCDIRLENPNFGGKGWTVFIISGLEIFKKAIIEENVSQKTDIRERTTVRSYD
jgi:K+-sensing histidine kinase KdpD